jgi:hypothetical protein
MVAACGVVAGVMGIAASAAFAGPPEWGQCVVWMGGNHTGGYTNRACTVHSGTHTGLYEWVPAPNAKPGFTGLGEAISLQTAGKRTITCASANAEGSYTGAKTEKDILTFVGCQTKLGAESVQCRSNPAKEGELESNELTGELGFYNLNGKKLVGVDLKPTNGGVMWTFTCGEASKKLVSETIEGSVIGRIGPVNGMVGEFKVVYTQSAAGKQAIQSFEGGGKDTLSTTLVEGLEPPKTEETSLKMKYVQTNEETLEINTVA